MNSDPRITAWALGELPPEERDALQARLMIDTDLRTEAKTAQDFCRFITSQLHDESAALTDDQRSYITAAAAPARGIRRIEEPDASFSPKKIKADRESWLRQNPLVIPLAAAALLIFGSVYYVYFDQASSAGSQKPVLSSLPSSPYHSIDDTSALSADEKTTLSAGQAAGPAVAASQPSSSGDIATDPFSNITPPVRRSIPPSSRPAASSEIAGRSAAPSQAGRPVEPRTGTAATNGREIAASPQPAKQDSAVASASRGTASEKQEFKKQVAGPVLLPASSPRSEALAVIEQHLNSQALPPREAVRLQALLQAFSFSYDLPQITGQQLSARIDFADAPWQPGGRMARIVIQATGESAARNVTAAASFDPASVSSCRILGSDDPAVLKAARIEPGGSITALCEITPAAGSTAALTLRINHQLPDGAAAPQLQASAADSRRSLADADADFKFAAALAAFALKLSDPARGSSLDWKKIRQLAEPGAASHPDRQALLRMIEKAESAR